VITAIWWVRRDQRLSDNQALAAALEQAEQVIPALVLDPVLMSAPDAGDKRVAFMLGGLRQLEADLRSRGSGLIVRRGDPAAELATLVQQTGAQAIFAEEDYWPYARQRDSRIAQSLPLHLVGGLTVHPPGMVLKADGTPYTVFTPFSRTWKALPPPEAASLLAAPGSMPALPELRSLPIPIEPPLAANVPFPPGEAEAQRRLLAFAEWDDDAATGHTADIYHYSEVRDRVDLDGTSRLSPYLRFGMLSARQAVVSALSARDAVPDAAHHGRARTGAGTWLDELIWREFYMAILAHFPHVLEHSFRANLHNIAWENDEMAFTAWCQGRTGYPVVDAAMRQLVETGWMHNRARMIVASFLVKDLLIDWQWGERFFMQHLVDGDPAANNGGWQWTAGTGTDAAPYFRIFNPTLQGKRHDPGGAYARRWVPELSRVPDRYIHEPWKMPLDVQREAGCIVGQDYPAPFVEHGWARERTLNAYAQARADQS
jgi:deoxyribodipyrimidine photo-lyase